MKETTLEANELALRAPNSQNGRLALGAPDSSDTFACFFLPANTKNQAPAAPDENTQMTLLAAAVLMRKITVLIDILSIKERP